MARAAGRNPQKPVIGVTGNNHWFSPSWICIRLAIALAGGSAVRISVDQRIPPSTLAGLVISGGDDIHPSLFGDEPRESSFYDEGRDALEQQYIQEGMARGLPMLGICRGHQLINVTLGGTLHQNIRHMRSKTYNRRGLMATKTVHVARGSRLNRITGCDRLRVNSLHYQAVSRLGEDIVSNGQDLDGFCQAMEVSDREILGVQWHPEYLFYLPDQLKLFRWLVTSAGRSECTH